MKITLRKASALQLLINEEINSTVVVPTVSIGRFDNVVEKRGDAVEAVNKAINKRSVLLHALYTIRKQVSKASQEAGISDVLADVACLDKITTMIKPLAAIKDPSVSEDVLLAKHKDLVEDKVPSTRYSNERRESFETGAITSLDIEQFKENLSNYRKRKQIFSDKLLDLNVRTEIELAPETLDALKQCKII